MDNAENKHFHFIAIGGIGMSGLAKYLLENGYKVTGSDIQESKYTKILEKLGAKIYIGHSEDNIEGTPKIVASTAIRETNPEIQKAKALGLNIMHRSDLLQYIANKFSERKSSLFIGFAGTHGKTTTSGLCSYILEKAGLKPSYVVGGFIPEINTNAKYASDNYFVAELDESDGTIIKYSPDINVINNLEEDHLDFYTNGFEDLLNTFNKYMSGVKDTAKNIINIDNEGNRKLIEANPDKKFITFGLNNADYTAKNIEYIDFGSKFEIIKDNKTIANIELSVPGEHNIYNALAVFTALIEANIAPENIINEFKSFTGMGRRFQLIEEFNNIKIIDDYAHHPSEIKATIESARNSTDRRLVAIFQPHRFSRLKSLWKDFMTSFEKADKLIVVDVYAASEKEIEGITSENFVNAIDHKDTVYAKGTIKEAAKQIIKDLQPNDIVLTLGAGDITKIGGYLKENYEAQANLCK